VALVKFLLRISVIEALFFQSQIKQGLQQVVKVVTVMLEKHSTVTA